MLKTKTNDTPNPNHIIARLRILLKSFARQTLQTLQTEWFGLSEFLAYLHHVAEQNWFFPALEMVELRVQCGQ